MQRYTALLLKQKNSHNFHKRLAESEEKHAAVWEKKIADLKVKVPPRKLSWRAQTLIWLAKRFGPQFVLPTITGNEKSDSGAYDGQPDEEAALFAKDEKSHARLIALASSSTGGLSGGTVAQLEGRHRASGGNALRAAVLGANDGLVSILSLLMGVAASAVGLFIIGAAITLMTGRSVWFSGMRQVLVGLAALTYGIGKLIGVSIA